MSDDCHRNERCLSSVAKVSKKLPLTPYTNWIEERYRETSPSEKEVNDPVWRTLRLGSLEVLLLDSSLFQRLRRIKQLGVAHWVYPSATHSRLEHSIGALLLVQRLVAAASDGDAEVPAPYRQALRVATLCHDAGHFTMSHVAEIALEYLESTEEIRNEFTDKYGAEKALGEINSYFLVGAPAFAELLRVAQKVSREMIQVAEPVKFIQQCIIGEPVDPHYPLLHQLVSGPFDADKLDWMTRDAYMSGVPVVTDVNRLIRKVRAVNIAREKAPLNVQKLSNAQINTIVVIGIDRSGNRTLDELTLGRTLLFDKLYRHHKVRACEAMVAAIIGRIARAATAVNKPWEAALTAVRLDDDALLTGAIDCQMDDESVAVVSHLAESLRNRRLFVRAVAFSQKMTGDPFEQDDEQSRGLQELLSDVEDPIRRRKAADEIARLTATALELLEMTATVEKWPGELSDYVGVDGVRTAEHLTASTKVMLIAGDRDVVPFEDEAPETLQWATAYQQTRDTAFVFRTRQW